MRGTGALKGSSGALIPILVFCQLSCPAARATASDRAHTFTFRLTGEPATLDWNKAYTTIETYVLVNLMEGLVGFDADLKPVPALAESWRIGNDGKTYTFKLRPGVKWSDGVPLRAQDFVFSWRRLLTPVTAASYAYFLYDIVGARQFNEGKITDFDQVGVKALDDHDLQVKLIRPVAHWIDIPTFWVTYPLRQDIVEKYASRWTLPGRMVTVGPFTLEAHDIDNRIVLKSNPYYYGEHGNIRQAVALIVQEDSTALSLFQAGTLDFMTDIASMDLKKLGSAPELRTFPYLKTAYLGMVVNKFPLNDPNFRRAIAMAIDKSKVGEILHGGQVPATTFVPPRLMGYDQRGGLPFDIAAAKKALRQSGVDTTRPLGLDLVLPNWDKNLILAQFIQQQLKRNLDLPVNIQAFDHKTFRAQLELHAFPFFENSWSADYPDPDDFLSIFLSGSGNNRTTWKNPRYDQLVLEARYSRDPKQRQRAYLEAERILLEESPAIIPLYYEPNMALVHGRVKGLELNPLNYLLLKKVNLE